MKSLFVEGRTLHIFAEFGVWVYAIAATIIAVIVVAAFEKISRWFSKEN